MTIMNNVNFGFPKEQNLTKFVSGYMLKKIDKRQTY